MRVMGGMVIGLLMLAPPALAQKPAPVPPAAVPGLPTVKPPPLDVTPPRAAVPVPPPPGAAPPVAPVAPPPAALAVPPPDEAPAIRRLRALFPADVQMTYRSASVVDEASQRVRLDGVTLRRPDSTVTIDEVAVEGQTDNGVREADLRGISVVATTTRVSIGRLRMAGLAIQRPPGGAPPQPENVTLARMSVEGLRVVTDNEGTFTLGSLTIEDFGAGLRTRVRIENFGGEQLSGGGYAFQLARASLSGVDIATFAFEMRTAGQPQPQTGRIDLLAEGLTVTDGGRALGGADSFRVESETDATQSGTGRMALRGLRFDGMPQIAAALRQLGYQSLVGDITMDAAYQANGGLLSMPALVILAPGYGRLTFGADFDRFAPGSTPEAMMANARLVAMFLRYRDEGLFARALRAQATEQRMTEQQLREQVIGMARGMVAGPAVAVLREPMERFLRGQASELELTARPPQPLPLSTVGATPPRDAADAQRRYGLTATAR